VTHWVRNPHPPDRKEPRQNAVVRAL